MASPKRISGWRIGVVLGVLVVTACGGSSYSSRQDDTFLRRVANTALGAAPRQNQLTFAHSLCSALRKTHGDLPAAESTAVPALRPQPVVMALLVHNAIPVFCPAYDSVLGN
jgi:hypothetical protein